VVDLVERAELDAAQGRIRLLEAQLRIERDARFSADRACGAWRRLALTRGALLDQLKREGVSHA
jgi:uncharacterized protein (DUF2461 family)